MGPLASAEFLSNIYKLNAVEPEQQTPACILFSDPSCPDRTTCIQEGTTSQLTAWLVASLEEMARLGAERIVIACITIHHVLPDVPASLRRRVVSLIDLVIDELVAAPRALLLLATRGTRTARIFESHPRWSEISSWVIAPGEEDQGILHDWIYRLKAGQPEEDCLAWLEGLPASYGVEGLLFGCTEFHLLHRNALKGSGKSLDVVDPLWIAARDLEKLLME